MIGETLGSYRVTAKIGQGGMGAVYAGVHPLMGRLVAIKVLLPELCASREGVDRFFNEARATARLRHPSFVDILDCGTHEKTGSAFIIMELLEGETLAARLERRGRLPAEEAAWVAGGIAAAIGIAHRAGIIHRDLKPDNVFLVRSGEGQAAPEAVKILDFGIAKLSGGGSPSATRTGAMLGTPIFMSPEQCRGAGRVDHRADVYSLGAMLFAMLCGRPPFDSDFVGELIGAHQHETPPAPRSIEPSVPPLLESLVLRSLAKSPDDRPQSMAQVADELAPFAAPFGPLPPPDRGSQAAAAAFRPSGPVTERAEAEPEHTTFSATASESRMRSPGRSPRPARIGRVAIAWGVGLALAGVVAFVMVDQRPLTSSPAARRGARPPSAAPRPAPAPQEVEGPLPAPPVPAASPPSAPPVEPPVPAPAAASAAAAREEVTIRIGNRRPGLRMAVTVDGRRASLPVRLPRDGRTRVIRVEIANFKPEEFSVTGRRDQTIKLRYRPAPLTRFD